MQWVQDVLADAENKEMPLSELCQEFLQRFDDNSALLLLDLMYRIALSDGTFSQSEIKVIHQVVSYLQISDYDHQQVRSVYELKSNHQDQYYEILQLKKPASKEAIKKAYRFSQ